MCVRPNLDTQVWQGKPISEMEAKKAGATVEVRHTHARTYMHTRMHVRVQTCAPQLSPAAQPTLASLQPSPTAQPSQPTLA